jgi:transposase-like protein
LTIVNSPDKIELISAFWRENMINLNEFACINDACPQKSIKGAGNIAIRCHYGKDKQKILLYCKLCRKTFSHTHGTALAGAHLPVKVIRDIFSLSAEGLGVRAIARHMEMDKDSVNDVILRLGECIAQGMDQLLRKLALPEVQMDELWAFVKKNKLELKILKMRAQAMAENGFGQP